MTERSLTHRKEKYIITTITTMDSTSLKSYVEGENANKYSKPPRQPNMKTSVKGLLSNSA